MFSSKPARIGAWLAAAALGGLAAVQSFAAALSAGAVDAAIATGWAGGERYASKAALSYITQIKQPPYGAIEKLAREGLRRKPLNATALTLIGLSRQARGQDRAALRLFKTAQKASRRDVLTHLAFINRLAAQGDLAGTLDHYDMALRTNNSAVELMIPILANAIRDERIQKGFADLVRQRPPWLLLVLDNLSVTTPHPGALANSLVQAGGLPRTGAFPAIEQRLLSRVVERNGPAAAREYYLSLPGARSTDLAALHFDARTTNPNFAPLVWIPSEDPNASGAFVRRGAGMALEGSAAPNASGTLASRILYLPPGTYRLAGRGKVDGDPGAALTMTLHCFIDGREVPVWQVDLSRTLPPLTVSQDCSAQRAIIALSAGEGALGAEAELSNLRLQRVG